MTFSFSHLGAVALPSIDWVYLFPATPGTYSFVYFIYCFIKFQLVALNVKDSSTIFVWSRKIKHFPVSAWRKHTYLLSFCLKKSFELAKSLKWEIIFSWVWESKRSSGVIWRWSFIGHLFHDNTHCSLMTRQSWQN